MQDGIIPYAKDKIKNQKNKYKYIYKITYSYFLAGRTPIVEE